VLAGPFSLSDGGVSAAEATALTRFPLSQHSGIAQIRVSITTITNNNERSHYASVQSVFNP
jgi:hypothetical protein